MVIGENTVIRMHFSLKDSAGKLLKSSYEEKPYECLYGKGAFAKGIDKALLGMTAGDEKTIVVKPEEGYGIRDKNLVQKVHRSELPEGEIHIGQEFRKVFSDGGSEVFRVSGFIEDWVYLDGNHPWAGIELHCHFKILDVQPALQQFVYPDK